MDMCAEVSGLSPPTYSSLGLKHGHGGGGGRLLNGHTTSRRPLKTSTARTLSFHNRMHLIRKQLHPLKGMHHRVETPAAVSGHSARNVANRNVQVNIRWHNVQMTAKR
jgi:hypothetical protein